MAMASSIPPSSATPNTSAPKETESIHIRSSAPIPLTASQEQEVRDLYYKNVRSYCADEIREFAMCATGRTFTIPFVCRQQRLAMEKCMNARATREEEDRAREQWFAQLGDRRKKRDEDEAWKEGQRQLKSEWWKDYREGKKS